jgi:hypothetical protein
LFCLVVNCVVLKTSRFHLWLTMNSSTIEHQIEQRQVGYFEMNSRINEIVSIFEETRENV